MQKVSIGLRMVQTEDRVKLPNVYNTPDLVYFKEMPVNFIWI